MRLREALVITICAALSAIGVASAGAGPNPASSPGIDAGYVPDSGATRPYVATYWTIDGRALARPGNFHRMFIASPKVHLEAIQLQKMRGYTWSGPGAPARLAGPGLGRIGERGRITDDDRNATVTWTRMGSVPGRPGNAHSGYVHAELAWYPDTHGGYTEAEWNDWSCPAGVPPPTFAKRDSGCTVVRTEHGTGEPAIWRSGLGIAARGPVPTTVISSTGVSASSQQVDYRTAPTGDTFVMPGWRRSLSTTGAGRLGWVDLGSASVAVRGGLSTLAWHPEDCTFLC